MRSGARVLHLALTLLFVAGLVAQVFLAGLGVFEGPTRFAIHRDVGYTLFFVPLLLLIAGLVGGLGRRMALLALAALLLFVLQSVFVALRTSAPTVAALHPVNGFLILLIALAISRDSWLARRTAAGYPAPD